MDPSHYLFIIILLLGYVQFVKSDFVTDMETWFLPAGRDGFGFTVDKYVITFIVGGLACIYVLLFIILQVIYLIRGIARKRRPLPKALKILISIVGVTTFPGFLISTRRLTVLWATLSGIVAFNAITYIRSSSNPPWWVYTGPISGICSWLVTIFLSYVMYAFQQPFEIPYGSKNATATSSGSKKRKSKKGKKKRASKKRKKDITIRAEDVYRESNTFVVPVVSPNGDISLGSDGEYDAVELKQQAPQVQATPPNFAESPEVEMNEVEESNDLVQAASKSASQADPSSKKNNESQNESKVKSSQHKKKEEPKTNEQGGVDGLDPTERDQSEFTFDSKGDNSFHDSDEDDSHSTASVESAVTVKYDDEHNEEFQTFHNHEDMALAGESEHAQVPNDEIATIQNFKQAVVNYPYKNISRTYCLACTNYGLWLAFPLATLLYLGVGAGGAYLILTYMTWMGRYGLISFCGLWIVNYLIGITGFVIRGRVYGEGKILGRLLYGCLALFFAVLFAAAVAGCFVLYFFWEGRSSIEFMDAYIFSSATIFLIAAILSLIAFLEVFNIRPCCFRFHWGLAWVGYLICWLFALAFSAAAALQGFAMTDVSLRDSFLYATALGWAQHAVIDNLITLIARYFLVNAIGTSFYAIQRV